MKKTAGILSCVFCFISAVAAQPVFSEADLPPDAPADIEAWELCKSLDALRQAGPAPDAASLSRALETFGMYRVRAFCALLQALAQSERLSEARERYLGVIGSDAELTRAGFDVISSALRLKNDMPALVEWTQVLTEQPLPEDLAEAAFRSRLDACLQAGEFGKAKEFIPVCLSRFGPAEGSRLVSEFITRLLESKKFEEAGAVIALLEKAEGDEPKTLAASEKVNLSFLQEQWAEAEKLFRAAAPSLPDGALSRTVSIAAKKALECGKPEAAERAAEFVLERRADAPAARHEAALVFVRAAAAKNDFAQIPLRLEQLLSRGVEPETVCSTLEEHFYPLLKREKSEEIRAMLAVVQKLLPLFEHKEGRARINALFLQSMLFDGTFMLEDYDGAKALVEKYYKEWEETEKWRDAAVNKIEAHNALKQGRKEEAVRRFREFMNSIELFDTSEYDPLNGIRHSREMTLGLNARRIGEILSSMDRKSEAAQAYAEAERYYAEAMKNVKPDSKEAEYIRKELEKVPKNR